MLNFTKIRWKITEILGSKNTFFIQHNDNYTNQAKIPLFFKWCFFYIFKLYLVLRFSEILYIFSLVKYLLYIIQGVFEILIQNNSVGGSPKIPLS
jgi:hypothetical protein